MSDWENKRQNIEKRISTKNFPKMKYLVQVVKVTSPNERRYVRVLLEGVVYAGHDMQGLIASLKSVLRGKCLEKIYFVPAGTIPQGVKASDEVVDPPEPPGLRWGGCAENMELCKNGECAPMGQCDLKNTNVRTTPTPGVGQNSNSSSGNTGTKANTSSSP